MNLNCVITDDEPIARDILEEYAKMIPGLNIIAKCRNAVETLEVLRHNSVDVLFTDIHMPGITGLDFIRSLKEPPAIIITTAYPNYAIDGFDIDAIDYLLKPISIDRFLRAINKVYRRLETEETAEKPVAPTAEKTFFFIKSNADLVKISYDAIQYIEGLENYVRIHCEDKSIISFTTMKHMVDLLSRHGFLRIHRSYIINLSKVTSVQNHSFKIGNTELAIGKSYRKSVAEVLKNYYSI